MGLSASLSNALSGMNTTQRGLEVLSRNVSNVGTPGYHRQDLTISEAVGAASTYARSAGVERAFSAALQRSYNTEISDKSYADIRVSFLSRVEVALGQPGDTNSLDTIFQNFEASLQALAVSPDDYATRAMVVADAQALTETLNELSSGVQTLRQETEYQMSAEVDDLNRMLSSLADINSKLSSTAIDEASRASMLDERDRLVQGVAEIVDLQVTYRPNDTVALMSVSGLGLLDVSATQFEFTSAGSLSPGSLYNISDAENGVGQLTATTPSGLKLNVLNQGLIGSGKLAGLIEIRDTTLVQLQGQLDEVAAALATSLNTVETAGSAVIVGAQAGFDIDADPAKILPGNEIVLNINVAGEDQVVRVVRVDDTSKLPMDYSNAKGERIIGADFSAGVAAVATALDTALGTSISVTNTGNTLQFLDDGAVGNSDITAVTSRRTASAVQGDGSAFSLFTNADGSVFSNSLDGNPQKRGFAGRISVNADVLVDNKLLVKQDTSTSLGDDTRPTFLIDRLNSMQFSTDSRQSPDLGAHSLSGTSQGLISQILNYQGGQISSANNVASTRSIALDSVEQRMSSEYGVNVDEEMARLMELQNAYAASARVVSIVQDLLNTLISI